MGAFDKFKLMQTPELRRFHYEPLYYDVKKDKDALRARKFASGFHGQRDPILHGTTMLEKMEDNAFDPYKSFSARYERRRNRLLLYLFYLALAASLWYAIW